MKTIPKEFKHKVMEEVKLLAAKFKPGAVEPGDDTEIVRASILPMAGGLNPPVLVAAENLTAEMRQFLMNPRWGARAAEGKRPRVDTKVRQCSGSSYSWWRRAEARGRSQGITVGRVHGYRSVRYQRMSAKGDTRSNNIADVQGNIQERASASRASHWREDREKTRSRTRNPSADDLKRDRGEGDVA